MVDARGTVMGECTPEMESSALRRLLLRGVAVLAVRVGLFGAGRGHAHKQTKPKSARARSRWHWGAFGRDESQQGGGGRVR